MPAKNIIRPTVQAHKCRLTTVYDNFGNEPLSYFYDSLGRVSKCMQGKTFDSTEFIYNKDGLFERDFNMAAGNPMYIRYEYDENHRLARATQYGVGDWMMSYYTFKFLSDKKVCRTYYDRQYGLIAYDTLYFDDKMNLIHVIDSDPYGTLATMDITYDDKPNVGYDFTDYFYQHFPPANNPVKVLALSGFRGDHHLDTTQIDHYTYTADDKGNYMMSIDSEYVWGADSERVICKSFFYNCR